MPDYISDSPVVGDDYLLLNQYAERAYLEYAMSVVKGRLGDKAIRHAIDYNNH